MRMRDLFSGVTSRWRAFGAIVALPDSSCAAVLARSATLESPALRKSNLIRHLRQHLNEYVNLQTGMDPVKLDALTDLAADARSLSKEIGAIPYYDEIEPLERARYVLIEHWRTYWTNGGISEVEYRARLKGAMLFLKNHRLAGEKVSVSEGVDREMNGLTISD